MKMFIKKQVVGLVFGRSGSIRMIKFNQTTQWFKEWMPGLIFFAVMGGPLSLGLAAQTNSPMNAFSLSAGANASPSNTDLIEVSISIKT